jgi:hypothetical protein
LLFLPFSQISPIPNLSNSCSILRFQLCPLAPSVPASPNINMRSKDLTASCVRTVVFCNVGCAGNILFR